jgi:hypothetical protein
VDSKKQTFILVRDLLIWNCNAKGRYAREQRIKHDLQLRARQRMSDALVYARPECQVVPGLASNIESIWLSEHRLITIGRCDDNQNAFAGAYHDLANFYVGDCRAAEPVLGNGQVA